jgi:hypothetical protein
MVAKQSMILIAYNYSYLFICNFFVLATAAAATGGNEALTVTAFQQDNT